MLHHVTDLIGTTHFSADSVATNTCMLKAVNTTPNSAVENLAHLIYFLEVPGSNIDPDINY
jgi:hypothetical protein